MTQYDRILAQLTDWEAWAAQEPPESLAAEVAREFAADIRGVLEEPTPPDTFRAGPALADALNNRELSPHEAELALGTAIAAVSRRLADGEHHWKPDSGARFEFCSRCGCVRTPANEGKPCSAQLEQPS